MISPMDRVRNFHFTIAALLFAAAAPSQAPDTSLDRGARIFATTCASCHGLRGAGGDKGPALANNRALRARTAAEIRSIIQRGTPAGMPAFPLQPAELDAITTYLRSLNTSAFELQPAGDTAAGEQFFFGKGQCATCHMVRGRGGLAGPELSNIGRQMTLPDLTTALADPSASIATGYAIVSVRIPGRSSVRGFLRSEGNHALVLQTLDGRLQSIDRSGATITPDSASTMPPLTATPEERANLIAYLSRLAGGAGTTPADGPALAGAFDQILHPKPGNWPTYHGRLDGNRHNTLNQINLSNVAKLAPQWTYTVRDYNLEMTPLVMDGLMYITGPNQVIALDAATGREIWRYSRPRTPGVQGDAGRGLNRGVALLADRVFYLTDDARLLSLNRLNGALLWEVLTTEGEDRRQPYGGTVAPLVVGDLVISGVSGGDGGIRGFLAAYHASTGKQAWRFHTIPAAGEPGSETWGAGKFLATGGGATWLTGTYDAESGTLYWPTGNPYPDTDGSERPGDNLYTDCILALDVKTGKLRWHYQFTPHDLHDWDAQEPPVLVDTRFQGRDRKLLLLANRNGFFYVLDRTNGSLLLAKPFVEKLTWASGIGGDGRPILLPGNEPTPEGTMTCPPIRGATNWFSTSFHPETRLFYVMTVEHCGPYFSTMFGGGRGVRGGPPRGVNILGDNTGKQVLRALDIETGKVVWQVPQIGNFNNYAGTLSTAGGLVFYGQSSGEFAAVDARTGRHLWHYETHENLKASPMTYMANGRQYVAIAAGGNVISFGLPK